MRTPVEHTLWSSAVTLHFPVPRTNGNDPEPNCAQNQIQLKTTYILLVMISSIIRDNSWYDWDFLQFSRENNVWYFSRVAQSYDIWQESQNGKQLDSLFIMQKTECIQIQMAGEVFLDSENTVTTMATVDDFFWREPEAFLCDSNLMMNQEMHKLGRGAVMDESEILATETEVEM